MALYRCGGGSDINPVVNTKNVISSGNHDSTANISISISATKNMKKALLVATSSCAMDGDTRSENRPVTVSSNRAITALPDANNNYYKTASTGETIHAACLLYLVNDVKTGDTFTLTQYPRFSAYYKNLTLVELD